MDLRALFDYQRFAREPSLQSVIDSVQEKYAAGRLLRLTDEEISMAAGGTGPTEELQREGRDDGHGTV